MLSIWILCGPRLIWFNDFLSGAGFMGWSDLLDFDCDRFVVGTRILGTGFSASAEIAWTGFGGRVSATAELPGPGFLGLVDWLDYFEKFLESFQKRPQKA